MIIKSYSLEEYFNQKIKNIKCRQDTSAYIINTLCNYKNSTYEFQNKSLTLQFIDAKNESSNSFKKFNELGDYILFMESVFPKSLNGASQEYYWSLASASFYRCYKLINRSWPLFEELADTFPDIINQLNVENLRA